VAALVARLLGPRPVSVDPGGGPVQLLDFDLLLDDPGSIAFEVTRHTLGAGVQTQREVTKRNWVFPALRRSWAVDTISSFHVRALHDELDQLLTQLEERHIESVLLRRSMFDEDRDRIQPSLRPHRDTLEAGGAVAAGRRLYELGVRCVYVLGGTPGGKVIIGHAPEGGSTGPSVIVDVAAAHANLADNATKLTAAGDRGERHLFVWAEHSRSETVAAIGMATDGEIGRPTTPPDLPDHVDAVWIATASDPSMVWRFHCRHGWEFLGTHHLR
jgi:hypothetical protein